MIVTIFSVTELSKPPRGTPYNGLYRETLPETSTHSRLQVDERTGISLVEVYERVKRWANRCTLWLRKSRENILVLPCIHNFKPVYLKGKGYLFCQKCYLTG